MGWMGNVVLLVATLAVLLSGAEVATRLFAKVKTPIVTRNPVVGSTYLRNLEEITPDGMVAQIDLTITDDFPLAQAIVIISAVAAND